MLALSRAAESGKQVTVVVELMARFDEQSNIKWARSLEESGAHVIYGIRGYKTHAKMCLVVRRGPQGIERYVHMGTGNYNEKTARIYTDFGLMTADRAIGEDASAFFNALTGYSDPPRMKRLAMAPTTLRERFLRLIQREQRRAEEGQAAEIRAKMNAQHPAPTFRQHCEITTRLGGLHQAERVFLIRHRQVALVVAGHLQEDSGVRPTFIRLPG